MEAPASFHRAIDRDATAPEILLDSKRIEETLRPTGLLFLVKKLFERSQVGHFQFARVGIVLETNRISGPLRNPPLRSRTPAMLIHFRGQGTCFIGRSPLYEAHLTAILRINSGF